jgi:hypothetical protein
MGVEQFRMGTFQRMTATTRRRGPSWVEKAITVIENSLYADHRKVTGEQVRNWLRKQKVRRPAHPNAYGALIRTCVGRNLLKFSGELTAMEDPRSHGRMTPIYTVRRPRVARASA